MHLALMLVIAAFRNATAADLLGNLRKSLYKNNDDYIQPPSTPPASGGAPEREAAKPLSKYLEVNPAKKREFVLPSLLRRKSETNETQEEAVTPDGAASTATSQPEYTAPTTARAHSAAGRANELGPPALKTRTKDESKHFKNEDSIETIEPVTLSKISTEGPNMRAAGGDRAGGPRRGRARKHGHRARGRAGPRTHTQGRAGPRTHAQGRADFAARPELLDMAPARGPRLHAKRLRNRLCQRSVLRPEGPKYDSKGVIYMHKFAPRGRGSYGFNATRPPALVLPRCCNCCRKSVLGCE